MIFDAVVCTQIIYFFSRKSQDLVYDIALHPQVLKECLADAELERLLVSLCWDYVENETDLAVVDRKDCKKV